MDAVERGIRAVRAVVVLASIGIAMLSGCASQPTLDQHEIWRAKTVKIVYLQPKYDVGVFSYLAPMTAETAWLEQYEVPHEFAYKKFGSSVPQHYSIGDSTDEHLAPYQAALATLQIKQRLFAGLQQAVESTPWLKDVSIEVPEKPTDEHYLLQHFRDSNADALIYLEPAVWLDDYGQSLHAALYVIVYAKPENGMRELYDVEEYDYAARLQAPAQDPSGPLYSIFDLKVDDRFKLWFMGHAGQLNSDVTSALSQMDDFLVHYLAGDSPVPSRVRVSVLDRAMNKAGWTRRN